MSVIEIRSQEHFEQLLRSTKVVLADCKSTLSCTACPNKTSLGSMVCRIHHAVRRLTRQGVGPAK
jgi:hypothetical protein